MVTPNIREDIISHLLTTKSIPINTTWLDQFLESSTISSRSSSAPLAVLSQTVLYNLLLSDIRASIKVPASKETEWLLPRDIDNVAVKRKILRGPIIVQVLDIEDIGRSAWSQIEKIEMVERGEMTRGREVIRTVNRDESGEVVSDAAASNSSSGRGNANNSTRARGNTANSNNNHSDAVGPHRLVLQDAAGTLLPAMELLPIPDLTIDAPTMKIGMKLALKDVTVARGLALLEPGNTTVLGGRIEELDKAWRVHRKERLLQKIQGDGS
ncbi:hypothetical protein AAP_05595 [Ascosphaera apis ARSEF 7405]|uniref:RecQ-mediated genome instability protein 1 n=1 Tax=Ascosphaera apis ARSEF 7405 TaxID=392613 RepID=A0A162IDL0_9EURO|nr:hypothetical protein AAP_05595 [Ascosphaera apis ARSEF 7405]